MNPFSTSRSFRLSTGNMYFFSFSWKRGSVTSHSLLQVKPLFSQQRRGCQQCRLHTTREALGSTPNPGWAQQTSFPVTLQSFTQNCTHPPHKKASPRPELPQPHLPTLKSQPKSSSMHDTVPRVVCFKPHSLHLPKLLVRRCLVFEHRFPMSLTNRPPIPCCSISSGTISTGDMLAPSQRLTGRLLLALFYTTIVGQEGLSMSSFDTSSQSYAALTAHCCHLSVFLFLNFIFKSLKTSDQCSRKARHVIEKLFQHTLGTIST